MKRFLPLLGLLFCVSGCAGQTPEPVTVEFYAMNTYMSVTAYGDRAEEAARAVQSEVSRLSNLWSRTVDSSEVSRLNASAGTGESVDLSEETAELLQAALAVEGWSGGAFDPAMGAVMDAWGFTGEEHRVPGAADLSAALATIEGGPILTDTGAEVPTKGQVLDLGGIAKGAAAARALLATQPYSDGLEGLFLNLGRNLTTWSPTGQKPDGTDWRVGVADPKNTGDVLCAFTMNNRTCATSGGYERYFEENGVTYHHIIDPATGLPARSGLASVTVVGPAYWVDAWSTALYVMGAEEALDLWKTGEAHLESTDLILVTEEGHVYVTEGLEAGFELLGEGYTYEIVSR